MTYVDALGREQEDLEMDKMREEGPHEHSYEFNEHCAAYVCTVFDPDTGKRCVEHKGLARCWCGWSETSPGRGQQELEEMGETIGSDEYVVAGITRRYT